MPLWMKWAVSFVIGLGLIALGWRFRWLLVLLHVLVSFLLIVVVLLQSGKAADLAGAFGGAGSQTAFGPRGAATFLSKATTWCTVMFMLTSMAQVLRQTQGRPQSSSVLERTQQSAPAQPESTPPAVPAPATQPPPAPAPTPPGSNAPQQ